ncbi:MAG: YqaA family protein [Lautropia sp.]|nr:YqaA family protein [Lautropia sp.]
MLETLLNQVIGWFALPKNGLATVFVVALVSATLLPMGSEPAVFAYVSLQPQMFWVAVIVATLGNTLGGIINYWLGRGAKQVLAPEKQTQYLRWFERLGPKALLFSFLPVVGDPLCAVAGWLRLPLLPCSLWMALGKFIRYVVMTGALLWVPDEWWQWLKSLVV